MLLLRFNSFGWLLLCAVIGAIGGCHSPWSAGPQLDKGSDAATTSSAPTTEEARSVPTVEKSNLSNRAGTATAPTPASIAEPAVKHYETEEPNLADVLSQVQQVGALDPDAQARLIEELQRTKPEMWPLVTQQFRATLAYHDKLTGDDNRRTTDDRQPVDAMKLASWEGKSASDPIALPTVSTNPLTSVDPRATPGAPPSSKIGELVDPRAVRRAPRDPARDAVIVETPGANPADRAPADFAEPDSASPIGTANAQNAFQPATAPTAHDVSGLPAKTAIQARFEVDTTARVEEPAPIMPVAEANGAQPLHWQTLVAQASDDLGRRVAASPQSTAEIHEHASLRLLRLLAGRTEESLEPIPRISPVEQDYWSRQLFALATYLDHHQQPDDKRRAAASVTHLDDAVAKLRELSSLSLRNLTFCKNVYGYGAYEAYDDNLFAPGQQVSIYVEVENYRSVSTEKGYSTLLGATFEILNEQGERVDGGEFPEVEDSCRSRRRDFHVQYGLTLSDVLPPGECRLQLVVKDQHSDKIGSAQLRFSVTK